MDKKALICLPTYNEKENLEKITAKIWSVVPLLHILVIDDNSPDGTGQIAEQIKLRHPENLHVLHRPGKAGLGRAYLDGFRWALEHGYDYIFEMDADFSHNPDYLPEFLKVIDDNDLVVGSRYLTGINVINWPMSRLLLSWSASQFVRIIIGLPFTDATGGFKCFRRTTLEALDFSKISSSGYSFQIELNYLVWKKGLKIREIPIIFVDRMHGTSKMSTGIVKEALLLIWKLRLKSLFR
ncbi:MAG: polyprenol monophosphomannose synthase [Fibrobacterota bacterium]